MSRATASARIVIGAVVSAAAVAAVVGAGAAPWPAVGTAAPSTDVRPAPAEVLLACDGPLLALARSAEDAAGVSAAADAAVVSGDAAGEPLEQGELTLSGVADATAPLFRRSPEGRESVPAAAASSVTARDMDLGGFAASECRAPQMESWIVGGDVATGTTGILFVANPTDANAVVSLDVFGVEGVTTPAGADAIAIPAGAQVPIPLAGIAGGEEAPAVRVTAVGSPVRVTLQSSIVRTLEPGGIDLQPAVAPAATQVVPGVNVTPEASEGENSSGLIRLLSTSDATATVTVLPEGGGVPVRAPEQVALTADQPKSADLGGLPAGRYTVLVDADQPVVAAAWQATGFGPGSDYAWYAAAPPVERATLFAAPDGPNPRVSVYNPGDEAATVAVSGDDGEQSLEVGAHAFASVALPGSGLYTLDPGGSAVHALLGFEGGSVLAALPITQDASTPQPLTVYP